MPESKFHSDKLTFGSKAFSPPCAKVNKMTLDERADLVRLDDGAPRPRLRLDVPGAELPSSGLGRFTQNAVSFEEEGKRAHNLGLRGSQVWG